MTFSLQRLNQIIRKFRFHMNFFTAYPLPSWHIKSRLGVEQEVQSICYNLKMPLRLHISAHYAKWSHSFSPFCQESRDNRMECFLTRFQSVWMTFIKREISPAVLQANACPWNDDPRAEAHIIALNKGNHIAFLVSCRQVD